MKDLKAQLRLDLLQFNKELKDAKATTNAFKQEFNSLNALKKVGINVDDKMVVTASKHLNSLEKELSTLKNKRVTLVGLDASEVELAKLDKQINYTLRDLTKLKNQKVDINSNSAKTSLNDLKNKSNDVQKSFSSWKTGLATGVIVAGIGLVKEGLGKANEFIKESVKDYREAQGQQAQLTGSVKSHVEALGGVGAKEKDILKTLRQQQDEMEKLGVADGDTVAVAQKQLATSDMNLNQVKKLTGATKELVTHQKGINAGAEDWNNTSAQIAKAANNSANALARTNTITKAQAKEIDEMKDKNERVNAIVKAIHENYGGSTDEIIKQQGAVESIKIKWGKAKEEIGNTSQQVKSNLFNAIGNVAKQTGGLNIDFSNLIVKTGEWISNGIKVASQVLIEIWNTIKVYQPEIKAVWEAFKSVASVVAVGVGGALMGTLKFIREHKSLVIGISTAFLTIKGTIFAIQTATKVWTGLQMALDVLLMANPLGLAVTAIGLVVGGVVAWLHHTGQLGSALKTVGGVVKTVGGFIFDVIVTPLKGAISLISNLASAAKWVGGAVSKAFGGHRATGGSVNAGHFYNVNENGQESVRTSDGQVRMLAGSLYQPKGDEIINNAATTKAMTNNEKQANVINFNPTIHVNSGMDENALIEKMFTQLRGLM